MSNRPCHSILWLSLTLAGCATQVPQSLPPQIIPKTFVGPITTSAQIWPEASWWQGFGDPELTGLIEKAQIDNRNIAAALARVMEAQAQATIQRAALFPQVDAGGNHVNGGCNGQGCLDFPRENAFGLNVSASYELDFWGLARDNLRAANELLKSAHFAQQSVALSVIANVADEYLDVLAIRARIAIQKEQIAAINTLLDEIKVRVKAQAADHLDLDREEAQLEAAEVQVPQLEISEKQALYSLAVLLGEPPEGFDIEAQNLDAILAPTVQPGLPSGLLLRRPDVAQAEAALASAHANVDAARAAFLPQISLTGEGGFVSTAIGALLRGPNFGYDYGANLLQVIFDGGKLIGQKDLAVATEKEFIANYQGAVLNAYADVEYALVQLARDREAEDHLRREIDAAREAFQITELQFREGATDLLNVLQAQQELFSAQNQMAQVVLASRQSAVHLFEALGGGWVENPEDRTQLVQEVSDSVPPNQPP